MLSFTGLGQDPTNPTATAASSAPVTATTFQCDDGTTVFDPSQCSMAVVSSPFMCDDGSLVDDPSQCPSAVSAPTVSCPDGSTAVDLSQCPTATSIPIAPGMITCPDGSSAVDPSQCPAVSSSDQTTAPAPSDSMQSEITGFITTTPNPTSANIADFLKLYTGADRMTAAQALIQQGVDPNTVSAGYGFINSCDGGGLVPAKFFKVFSLLAALAGAYHGVRRHNGSIGWGIWWGFAASMFPVLTTVLAIGQGFAKPRAV